MRATIFSLWQKALDLANQTPQQCESVPQTQDALWSSPLGEATLSLEQPVLAPLVRRLHGDSVVWAGSHRPSASSLQQCMVRSCIHLVQEPAQAVASGSAEPGLASLTARLDALPFRSNALDGIVLHHALEQACDPRVALREVARVLAPGGRAIIAGFNPLSLIGARRLYARSFRDALSGHRMVNPLRLYDWLMLLGLEMQGRPQYCGFGLPYGSRLNRLQQPGPMPFGEVLIVEVVKQAVALRPPWRLGKKEPRLAPVAYPRVASWQRSKS